QQLDWSRHKVWCKLHSSRAQSIAGASSEPNSASSSSAAAAAGAPSAVAPQQATSKRMESIRRIDSAQQALNEQQSTAVNGEAKKMMMTTSSSGSSQTSGHSSGTDCSLNSLGGAAAAPAAAADPLAALFAGQSSDLLQMLQLQHHQQQLAPQLPIIDPAALLAASNNSNALFSNLALMASQLQQAQQQQQAAAAAAAAAAPLPQLFPPLLGSLSQLGLTGFSMPPPPSAFPAASAFDTSNAAALIAALTSQATAMQQQPPPPRFDLGAADPTPLMSSLLSRPSISSSSLPPTSAFSVPPPRPSVVSSTPFHLPASFPSSSSSTLRSASSSSSSIVASHPPTTVPNPFTADCPSSMQKIIDPKPSMTLPALQRPKAVAARRSGKPAALAAAAAAVADASASGGGASGSSCSSASGSAECVAEAASVVGSLKQQASPDRFERPEGTRKRTTPSPQDAKCVTVDNSFLMQMPLDYEEIHARMQPKAGAAVKNARRPAPPPEEDDDCQVIGQVINRRYKDHTKNVVYNMSIAEHMAEMRNRGILVNRHQASALRLRYIAEHVIRSLNEFGWSVVDNYLGNDHVEHCAKEMEKLYEKGLFTAGQLMDNSEDEEEWRPTPQRNEDDIKNVRSDYIYWYDGVDERATEAVTTRLLVSMLDAMILHFDDRIENKSIGGRSRAMLAIYPGGSTRYVKHVDNPNLDGRLITCIYYCNAKWNLKEHGGALRLFPETSECAMDIDPQADRLVFFWSDRRNPHEVMPVHRHRFAITIWYMDKTERRAALERKARRRAAARAAAVASVSSGQADQQAQLQQSLHLYSKDVLIQQPQLEKQLQQLAAMRHAHASAPHMGDGRAASAAATAAALGLPPQAATVGRAASPRCSRSEHNMAQRFEAARSECTQEQVESDEEEMISDFIPNTNEAQPDYEI
ncbi:hypothetical protein PENTCL1PPCAC_3811, partial [Pristionchus entomophagus]